MQNRKYSPTTGSNKVVGNGKKQEILNTFLDRIEVDDFFNKFPTDGEISPTDRAFVATKTYAFSLLEKYGHQVNTDNLKSVGETIKKVLEKGGMEKIKITEIPCEALAPYSEGFNRFRRRTQQDEVYLTVSRKGDEWKVGYQILRTNGEDPHTRSYKVTPKDEGILHSCSLRQ